MSTHTSNARAPDFLVQGQDQSLSCGKEHTPKNSRVAKAKNKILTLVKQKKNHENFEQFPPFW